jgi:putative peptidoglycan lipid II flippase
MSRAFFRTTAVVGVTTFLSRVTGLMRDMVFTRMFPTSTGVLDAFLVAYQIPNYLRRLFAEGAFSQAFVPVVSQYRAQKSKEEVADLVGSVAGTLGSFLALLSILGVLIAPVIVWLFAPGMGMRADTTRFDLTVEVLRWTFPYLLFISLTALAGGVLNSYDRFAIPAFASVLLNVVLIAFAAWISPHFANPAVVLAIGVFIGGILQLAIHLPTLWRLGLLRWPRLRWRHEGVRRIGSLMGPAIIGSSMGQLAVTLNSIVASFLATGSYAWLYCADRLVEFPLGVFAIALSTVILPSLSAHHAQDSVERFSAMMEWALRLVFMVVIPASVALFVLAGPLTVVMFHDGQEFKDSDVYMTRAALMAYSVALLGWSFIKVLAPGYFARQDTKGPVRIAMQALGLNMALNVVAVIVLAYMGWLQRPGMHTILASTNAVGALFNAVLLYTGLRRAGVLKHQPGWWRLFLQVGGATAAMAMFLLWTHGDLSRWLIAGTWERVWRLSICVGGGAAAYGIVLMLAGVRPSQLRLR